MNEKGIFFKGFNREHARVLEAVRQGANRWHEDDPTSLEALDDLIRNGLVYRDRHGIGIDSEYGYLLGVDIGGTSAKSMLIDFAFMPVAGSFRSEDRGRDIESFRDNLGKALDGTMASASPKRILGIGIALPGTVDPIKGKVLFTPNIQFLSGLEAGELLPERYRKKWEGVRIKLEHDCKAAVVAEKLAGGPKHSKRHEESRGLGYRGHRC